MKNKLFVLAALLLALIFLVSCREAGKDEETTADIPENGIYYEYSGTGAGGLVESSTTYENGVAVSRNDYDYWPNGRLKSIVTTKDDKVTDTWYYNYSENGLLSQMVRHYTEDGYECRDDYRYDDEGYMISLSVYSEEQFVGGERYAYTEKGELSKKESLDRNGDVISYTQYSFDEKGRETGSETYMYGSRSSYSTCEYNDKGQLETVSYFTDKDSLTHTVVNEYNDKGKLAKTKDVAPDGTVKSFTECLYDDDGFNYRDIFYVDGKPVYRYDYTKDGARIYSSYN